jgi:four helix bundle protein
MAFKFEDLRVWKLALGLTSKISQLTQDFPQNELYVLSSQIRRASDSVALNIAEGSTGQSNKEFKRFLTISIRSGIEVIGCLHIGRERGIIDEENFRELYNSYEELIIKIQALKKSID